MRADRLPSPIPDEFLPFAPDLAVETLSSDDKPKDVREKIGQWLSSRARAVWTIDSDRREVTIHRPRARPRVLKEGDVLDGEDFLPGFRIQVSEIFE